MTIGYQPFQGLSIDLFEESLKIRPEPVPSL